MNTLAVVNLVVCATALTGALAGPWLLAKWKSWRSGTAELPVTIDDKELDEESKRLISAARALLVARMRAKDNPELKAAIEKALDCLPKFVCKGASNA